MVPQQTIRVLLRYCSLQILEPIVLVGLIFLISVGEAHSATFILLPDDDRTVSSVSTTDTVDISVLPDHSYCVEIFTFSNSTNLATFGDAVDNAPELEIVATPRGDAHPRSYSDVIFTGDSMARTCVVTTGTQIGSNSKVRFPVDTSAGGATGATLLRHSETTLTGGFNTSVTDFNFLELTNSSVAKNGDNGVVSGTVIIRNVITDQEALRQSFTVNPGDRVDINIHDAVGAEVFGIVTVVHDAIPGALTGVVSQYRIVSASPLDFEPVVQQPLLTAAGRQ